MTENRGGTRTGAGRKPKGKQAGKKVSVYLTADLIDALREDYPALTTPGAVRQVITDKLGDDYENT
jgi:hypothetical protein